MFGRIHEKRAYIILTTISILWIIEVLLIKPAQMLWLVGSLLAIVWILTIIAIKIQKKSDNV